MCFSRKVHCNQLAMSAMDAEGQRRGLHTVFLAISDLVKCSPFTVGETEEQRVDVSHLLFYLQSQDNICHTVSAKVCGNALHETNNPVLEPQFCVLLKLDKWPFGAWHLAHSLGVFLQRDRPQRRNWSGAFSWQLWADQAAGELTLPFPKRSIQKY